MPIPPIYIISLKRTPERKLQMQRQLDAFNLSYQFVDAVDKHLLHLEEYRTTIANQLGIDKNDKSAIQHLFNPKSAIQNLLSSSYVRRLAIRLSHIKVYNLMIKNNIPVACVLEDDAFLLPSFPKILNVAQRVSWDVLMLAHKPSDLNHLYNPDYQSPYRFFVRLMRYKRYCPQLNSFTIRSMIFNAIKVFFLRYIRRQRPKYPYSYKIGVIPNKEKPDWYKATSNHYIANPCFPSPEITSAMTYMLTLPAAIKWKEIALRNDIHIDHIPRHLYNKGKMDLRLLVPPCSVATTTYTCYSARTK